MQEHAHIQCGFNKDDEVHHMLEYLIAFVWRERRWAHVPMSMPHANIIGGENVEM